MTAELREQGISRVLRQEAAAALEAEPEHPLWTRGLLSMSSMPELQKISGPTTVWHRNGSEGTFTGQ